MQSFVLGSSRREMIELVPHVPVSVQPPWAVCESSRCSASSPTLHTRGGVSCSSVILIRIYLVRNEGWQYLICFLDSLYLLWKCQFEAFAQLAKNMHLPVLHFFILSPANSTQSGGLVTVPSPWHSSGSPWGLPRCVADRIISFAPQSPSCPSLPSALLLR